MHQMFIKVFILTEVYKVPRAQPKLLTMSQMFTTNWFTMSQVFTRNNGLPLQEKTVYHATSAYKKQQFTITSVYKKQWFTMPQVFTTNNGLRCQKCLPNIVCSKSSIV